MRGIKLAISGKGGVGKSTLAAALSRVFAARGQNVVAIDADPDANLASALGLSLEIKSAVRPLALETALIEQRTGARPRPHRPDIFPLAGCFGHCAAVRRSAQGCFPVGVGSGKIRRWRLRVSGKRIS